MEQALSSLPLIKQVALRRLPSGWSRNGRSTKPPQARLSLYSGACPHPSCEPATTLQAQNLPHCFLPSSSQKTKMISPTFPSSPPHFVLCPAHQTKARSHRAISEGSSPGIPSRSGEMVLMGRKRQPHLRKESQGTQDPASPSKDSSTLHNLVSL